MDWLNLHIARDLRSPACIGSSPTERATWLFVLAYCCEQENGGRIEGGATWKNRQWQQACGVTVNEVKAADKLILCDGADVVVRGYPVDSQRKVIAKRESGRLGGLAKTDAKANAARANGEAGGRPENPSRNPSTITQAPPSINPTKEKEKEKGEDKGEGEGDRALVSPSDRWPYIQAEAWVATLKGAGCKIGPKNWPTWKGLSDRFTAARVASAAEAVTASERWPDSVEEALDATRGQTPINQAVASKIQKLEL